VLLLDEMDKAHPGVQDVFFQLFDKGSLRDGEGRDIDFKNTTILMTANTGSEVLASLAADPDTMPPADALPALLKDALLSQFKAPFLGRVSVLAFLPLDRAAMEGIVEIQLGKVRERVAGTYGASLSITPAAAAALVESALNTDAGARAIETRIAREILPLLSGHFLSAIAQNTTKLPVAIALDAAGDFIIHRAGQTPEPRAHSGGAPLAPDNDASRPPAGPRDAAPQDPVPQQEQAAV